jgi:DNA mismatch repair protein MutH
MERDALLEERTLDHLWQYHPQRVADVAARFDLAVPRRGRETARSFFADLLKLMLDAGAPNVTYTELEMRGYSVKTVRMPREALPYEAMSFRAFSFEELLREEWTTSNLRHDLARLLIATFYAPNNSTGFGSYEVGHQCFWTPTDQEWAMIESDWHMYLGYIRRGEIRTLPPASETKAIHVRPHAQTAADTDILRTKGRAMQKTKQSFWLNREFVLRIVAECM